MSRSVLEFGVARDGTTLVTAAINSAIAQCGAQGGGVLTFPPGRYLTGTVQMASHVTLFLEPGAVILGSQNPQDYPLVRMRWEGAEQLVHSPLLTGTGLTNIAITGQGTIDGQGEVWWDWHRSRPLPHARPRLISFVDCSHVLIHGITARNSPAWTITPLRCDYVTIEGVTVLNPWGSPNTDGINPDSCRFVHIANCHIDVGDDCITIKSGREGPDGERSHLTPCEHITITNCTMAHGHGGVVIGSEMSGDVRNVVISNCVFVGTERGLRIKSRRGRGGVVEDIRATNIVMQDVRCPFILNLYYDYGVTDSEMAFDRNPRPVNDGTPRFRRITFAHITARNAQYAAGFLLGLPEMPIEDVVFEDVCVSMAKDAPSGFPDMAPGFGPYQRGGLIARHVHGLRLRDLTVLGQLGDALVMDDVLR